MIKKSLAIALSLAMVVSFVGCSSDNDDEKETTAAEQTTAVEVELETAAPSSEEETTAGDTKVNVSLEKSSSSYYGDVELADYSEFIMYENEKTVSEDELKGETDAILNMYKTNEETDQKDVTDDCVANIDFVGILKVNGEDYEFPNGSGEEYDLDIGNSNFFEGFAEAMIGMKVGETKDLDLQFPDNYGGSTQGPDGEDIVLAGQPVVFRVTVNSIKKVVRPELTDEFVQENLKDEFDGSTVEDLNNFLSTQIRISRIVKTTALEDYVAKCKVELDEDRIEQDIKDDLTNFKASVEEQSMTFDEYLEQYESGKSEDEYIESMREKYHEMYKVYAVINKIAEENGFAMNDDTFNTRIDKFSKRQGYESVEQFVTMYEGQYGAGSLELLPLQFQYEDALTFLIDKGTVEKGERPSVAE